MIYDYTDNDNWSEEVDDWTTRFNHDDLVIGPGYGSFRTMVVVHEIDPDDEIEKITHKGVFWEKAEAEAYAEGRHARRHGGDDE